MSTESDAALFARFPHEAWGQPVTMTNLETREVRYFCKLCTGLNAPPVWEELATDETVILTHIKEQHGLEPVASVYVTPEEAAKKCKAIGVGALIAMFKAKTHHIFHRSQH